MPALVTAEDSTCLGTGCIGMGIAARSDVIVNERGKQFSVDPFTWLRDEALRGEE